MDAGLHGLVASSARTATIVFAPDDRVRLADLGPVEVRGLSFQSRSFAGAPGVVADVEYELTFEKSIGSVVGSPSRRPTHTRQKANGKR